jgi:hypothetical protein
VPQIGPQTGTPGRAGMPEAAQGGRPMAQRVARGAASRTLASLAAPLTRALHQVDTACMAALAGAITPHERRCAQLEVTLWAPLRRALLAHIRETSPSAPSERIDAVLADSLLEFVDGVLQRVADVGAGGSRRLGRYLGCCREFAGQLDALGGSSAPQRAVLLAVAQELEGDAPPVARLEAQLVDVHAQLLHALHALAPRAQQCLLDDIGEQTG